MYRQKIKIGANEIEKLVIKPIEDSVYKWMYLVGDSLTYVRIKSFVTTIKKSLFSFEDDYEVRYVLSNALQQVIL